MKTLCLALLLAASMARADAGEGWDDGHVGHATLLKTEIQLVADEMLIKVGEVEIKGKLIIPCKSSGWALGNEYPTWGADGELGSDLMHEDVGGAECIWSAEWESKLVPNGHATFEHNNQTIVLTGIPPKDLIKHAQMRGKFMQKIKMTYSYKGHGENAPKVEKVAWTEC